MKRFAIFAITLFIISSIGVGNAQTPTTLITIENAASITELIALEGHAGAVNTVAFSPDGTLLAAGGEDMTVRLWDTSTMEQGALLEGHEGGVNAVVFNPDGTLLASTGYDLNVLVWDTVNGTMSDQSGKMDQGAADFFDAIAGIDVGFHALAWFNDVPLAAGEGGLSNFAGDLNYFGGAPTFYSFDVSLGGLILAAGTTEGVKVVSASNDLQGEAPVLSGHTDAVLAVKFSLVGDLLASASADDTVRLWNVADPENVEAVATLVGHRDDVTGVAFSPDGTLLVSASLDGTLRIWDVAAQTELATLSAEGGAGINGVAFSPDGSLIASAGADGLIRLWGIAETGTTDASGGITIRGTIRLSTSEQVVIPGAEIDLNDGSKPPDDPDYTLATTTTDSDGNFEFTNIEPGAYVLGLSWPLETANLSGVSADFHCDISISMLGDWLVFTATNSSGQTLVIASADLGEVQADSEVVSDLDLCP